MNAYLEYFKQDKILVTVFANPSDPTTHISGIIIDYSEDGILLNRLTKDGNLSQLVLINDSNITKIEYDTNYLNKQEEAMNYNEFSFPYEFSISSFLDYLFENELVCDIDLIDGTTIYGEINSIEDNAAEIKCYDQQGNYDGMTIVEFDVINTIWADIDF